MKKLLIALCIFLLPALASASWTLNWNDVTGEDGYIVSYKNYPAGYSYPDNPAPANLIQDVTGATKVNLPANSISWDLPVSGFAEGNRYVFFIQATASGSVSGYSDFLCWTYPALGQVIELPLDTGGNIQINIYQNP